MKILKLILISLVLTLCDGCKCRSCMDATFYFANNAPFDVKVYYCIGPYNIYPGAIYPDTTLLLVEFHHLIGIQANRGAHHGRLKENFELMPTDTMSIFWFHSDTLNKYPWSEIQKGYKILARYDLGIQDLANPYFEITYPPNEGMKGRKMFFPPKGDSIKLQKIAIKNGSSR